MYRMLKLWRDEAAFVVSSELVLVGTVGVVGATVGLSALATAANEELKEVASAIRSLDQSYEIKEVRGCGAWTAGSSYRQQPVEEALQDLQAAIQRAEKQAEERQREVDRQDGKQPGAKPEQPAPKKTPAKKKPQRDEEEVVL